MKKHILGLMLFGFIVGAAWIVYAVFNVNWFNTPRVSHNLKNRRSANVSPISQPTLDMKNGNFIFETDCAENSQGIVLYLYEKNGNETKQIVIQHVSAEDLESCHDSTLSKKTYWTNLVGNKNNLYVVAYADGAENASPYFDESRALPVLLSFDKN